MTDVLTNMAAEAAAGPSKMELMQEYVSHHSLFHAPNPEAWNLPFLHVAALEYLHLDQVMVPFSALLLVLLCALGYRRNQRVPRGFSLVLELLVKFIRDHIVVPALGEHDGRRLTPLFCTFFFFILTMNLLGLLPFCTVATSNVSVTGALALLTFGFMVFGSIAKNGLGGFFKTFMLPGVPKFVLILVTPLELMSLFTNTFALMIRLFANMLAGHIVIYCMVGMVFLFGVWALPAALMAVAMYLFEFFVCCFQAYIFTLLSAVFIGKTYHASH